MTSTQRCGTGDSGCSGPAMDHSSSNMCNGVFKPVCAPEICDVPRIPHHEKLVEGKGSILDNVSGQRITFNILVEREMQVYKGVFEAQDTGGGMAIKARILKFFEGDGKTYMLAIFYEETTDRDIIVTVYKGDKGDEGEQGHQEHQKHKKHKKHKKHQKHQGHPEHDQEATQVFIYSTSREATLINLGGKLVAGDIKLYVDHNVHEH